MSHQHSASAADEVLIHNIGEGCAECFACLFERYCRHVVSVAFRILRDRQEAEDILQEVFLAIYLQREKFDASRGSVKTWILQFAYFKSLLRRRYLRIRNFYTQEEFSEEQQFHRRTVSEALGLSSAEWARFVESGIAALGPKQRQVVELVHFEGYTLQETSEIVRETFANTRNYYYRGLKALRTFLNARSELKRAQEKAGLPANGAIRVEP
ncbi:MAG: sigma-70 family RNA polymerase sigma factor [Acidobacteriia bacterium]|nr:sigma-70 family RNA polymerase sigma factor [Terriglobia bacterium]